ncbi:MAG: helicase-associated domain-containing protein [Chloroflexi bacterium]|nr:helicase-associated domain-containing protein [Chloroflexota bacterium]
MKLIDLLAGYDANTLKAIARKRGAGDKGNKNDVMERLARDLARADGIARALKDARPVEQEIIAHVQRSGHVVNAFALRRVLLARKLVKPSERRDNYSQELKPGNPDYAGKPALEDAVAHLTALGIVFSRGVAAAGGYRTVLGWDLGIELIIPDEVRPHLPLPPELARTAVAPARVVEGSPRIFQRDLSRIWSYARRSGGLTLSTTGWLYKKDARELVKLLGWSADAKAGEDDLPRLYFARQLLRALNLLRDGDGQVIGQSTALSPVDDGYWARPAAERANRAFESYRTSTYWNELLAPAGASGYDRRRRAPAELAVARAMLLKHCVQLGVNHWVALPDLLDRVRLADYQFLFPRQPMAYGSSYGQYYTPYIGGGNPYNVSYPGIHDEAEGWEQVEAAILAHMLSGPLHWLGLIDLGYEKERLVAYRLNAFGAWLLGQGGEIALDHEGGRIVVQPNYQIVAMEPIRDDVLLTLEEFAQFEGGDNALSYTLSRESVYRAQRAGWDGPRIAAWLVQVSGAPLPQNVQRTLEEWQAQSQRIVIRRSVTVLHADSGETLDALNRVASLAPLIGQRQHATVALLDAPFADAGRALREAGWPLLSTRAGQTSAPASLTADADGRLHMVGRVPSVFAHGAVEAFAELGEDGQARISADSVRAAVAQNISVPEIIKRLESVHRGPVPDALIRRIRAWGRYYGDARLGTLVLIEFRDDAARAELLADRELAPYLTRFDAGPRALAVVRADAPETVRQLLAERGVEITAL